MKELKELEEKIRQSIPELKEEYEAFQDGSIDRDMITPIMLNHVLTYVQQNYSKDPLFYVLDNLYFATIGNNTIRVKANRPNWNLKSAYLKDQSEELITFLNELK